MNRVGRYGATSLLQVVLLWGTSSLWGQVPFGDVSDVASGAAGNRSVATQASFAGSTQPSEPRLSLSGKSELRGLVRDVKIQGNQTVEASRIYEKLRTRKDREFDSQVVQSDVRRLLKTGLFRDVKTYTQQTTAGIVVTFQVSERPNIRYVKFVGNRGLRDKHLTKQIGLKRGDALNSYVVEEAKRSLEQFYRSKGYPKVKISIFEGMQAGDQGVVFLINEGYLERIKSVHFVGNDPNLATDGRLKTVVDSKPGFLWYLFGGTVDHHKIDEDVDKLTAYYRGLGYFRARIGREREYDESGRWVTLTFVIDEGPRYALRNISVIGNTRFPEEALLEKLALKRGEFFDQGKMDRDEGTMRDLYGGFGHIFADIQAELRFLEEPGQLDLVYNIEEGNVFRVGKINVHIAGEFPHTKQSVILNRLSLSPGDIIDIREVRASERRLRASQLFESNPQQGLQPKIVIRPPELEESMESTIARGRRAGPTYRGQSPEQAVGRTVRKIDLNVYAPELRDAR